MLSGSELLDQLGRGVGLECGVAEEEGGEVANGLQVVAGEDGADLLLDIELAVEGKSAVDPTHGECVRGWASLRRAECEGLRQVEV